YKLEIRWVSGHTGIEGNELVDEEAKEAAQGRTSGTRRLPAHLRGREILTSTSALKQEFAAELKARWREQWTESPRYARQNAIDDSLPSPKFQRLTRDLAR
ncbi:hypothetical protein PLICRDRAFT_85253, partial [Plicaturopsis crispa FD-325 SS-3]